MFAPAERASEESVSEDSKNLATADHVAQVVPSAVMILNEQRQVVFKNHHLMNMLGVSADEDIFWKHPDQLLECIHSKEKEEGFESTEFCREYGAVQTILESQHNLTTSQKECHIITVGGKALDFRVWAMPYEFRGKSFTIFSILDIENEKRHELLETTFFHDINNILNSLHGNLQLLNIYQDENKKDECASFIQHACSRLVDEIGAHKRLLEAEKGRLQLQLSTFRSTDLLKEILKFVQPVQTSYMAQLSIDPHASDFELTTDRVLLMRVLHNMVKNAVEAEHQDSQVVMNCQCEDSKTTFSIHNSTFMPRNIQLQVFQRSFSTKGKGRGIGTYSMKLFTEKYLRGTVWFETCESKGTIFSVSIPNR